MLKKRSRSALHNLAGLRSIDSSRLIHRRQSRQFEQLETRQVLTGGLTLATLGAQTIQAGAPLQVAVNATDTGGNSVAYLVTSTNPAITATLRQSHEYLKLHVTHASSGAADPAFSGDLVIELFPDAAPNTVAQIVSLANQGFYNSVIFHRIVKGFVVQAGLGTAADAGIATPNMNNEITEKLRYSGSGVVGMARTGADDSNNSQFFITAANTSFLDYQYTIFGQLVSGDNIRALMDAVPVDANSNPLSAVTITASSIIDDPYDLSLSLSAPLNTIGSSTITVTANDGHGGVDAKTFIVNVSGNAPDPGPFLTPIAPPTALVNTPVTFQIPIDNQYGDTVTYYNQTGLSSSFGKSPTQSVVSTVQVNSSTGQVTVTPPTGFVGVTPLFLGVASSNSVNPSTRMVPLFVDPAAPISVSLLASSDTGSSNNDGLTSLNNADSSHKLQFLVNGVTAGDEVDILDGTTVIGTAVASSTSVTVTTNGSVSLADGAHHITAKQILKNVSYTVGNSTGTTDLASGSSTERLIDVDATAPIFSSSPPLTIQAGQPYPYTALASDNAGGALVYSLAAGPSGVSVNGSTGVVTWTPSQAQFGRQSVQILATDAAGNAAVQSFTVNVLVPPVLPAIANQLIGPGNLLNFTAQANDANPADTFTYSLGSGAPSGASIDAHTGVFSWRPTTAQASQNYVIAVNVVDSFNQTTSGNVQVQVTANIAPQLDAIANQTVFALTELDFTARATDANPVDTFTYSLSSGAPSGASLDPTTGQFRWTPTFAQADADYTLTVKVVDAAGLSATTDVQIHVNAPVSPVLNAINPLTVYFGSTASFTAVANDTNAHDSFTYSLGSGVPAGVAIDPSTGVFTWKPTAGQTPGDYEITVTATNAASLTDSTTAVVHVLAAVNPTLAVINAQTISAGRVATFTAQAADVNPQDTFTYSLGSGAPAGATIDASTGIFHWTPTAAQALQSYDIQVVATEAGGLTATQTATIKVLPPAPSLASVAQQKITAGDSLSLSLTATDATPSETFTYSLASGSPAGANINAATGAFSWATSKSQLAGSYPITVVVTDAAGLQARTTFSVAVSSPVDLSLTVGASELGIGNTLVVIASPDAVGLPTVSNGFSITGNSVAAISGSTFFAAPLGVQSVDVHGDWMPDQVVTKKAANKNGDDQNNSDPTSDKTNDGASGEGENAQTTDNATANGKTGAKKANRGKSNNSTGADNGKRSLDRSQGANSIQDTRGSSAYNVDAIDWSFELIAGGDELAGRATLASAADLISIGGAKTHSDEVRPAWMARAMMAKKIGISVSSSSIAEKRATVAIVKIPSKQMAVLAAKIVEPTVASLAIAAPAAAALFLPLLVTEAPQLNSRKGSRGLARFWR